MPKANRQGVRRCYCDLHVSRGERIPFSRWVQHQERLWAELDLQGEEAQALQAGTVIQNFITDHSELTNEYDQLEVIAGLSDGEEQGSDVYDEEGLQASISDNDIASDSETYADLPIYVNDNRASEQEDEDNCSIAEDDTDLDGDSTFIRFSSFDLQSLNNVANWRIEDENLHYAIKLAIWKIEHRVSDTAFRNRPLSRSEIVDGNMSLYRVKKQLKLLTGLSPQLVPCCANNCSAWTDSTDSEQECSYCGEKIYEEVDLASGRIVRPRKTFFYFSPIERLLLEYANPTTSQEMSEYTALARRGNQASGTVSDFWNGSHYMSLRTYFSEERTLALTLSTDSVQNVRQKSSSVWPILLTILNYPPELRARSMMIVGLIPGPCEPAVFSSFFDSLLLDLKKLSTGIQAYDGYKREQFLLRAHLTVITGDMPAIAKLMAMKGSNGLSPCRFCTIKGQYSSSSRHFYYPRAGQALHYRDNLRREALMVAAANDERIRKSHGISGLSFLMDVKTLNFPYSFGLDIMHLFSNVAKAMWNTWTGQLLPEPIFDDPQDSYLLSKTDQAQIGKEMCDASEHIPVFVSRTPRDISKHKNSFKAVDWFQFVTIFSSPLLYKRLPDYALTSWQYFVKAVRLALATKLSDADIHEMEILFQNFVDTTESIYYQDIEGNLAICTSQLHALLHVGATVRALGPTFVSWQFGLERYAGQIKHLTTSKSQLNVSLYNGLEMLEQLRYVRLLYNIESSRPINASRLSKEIANATGQKIGSFTGRRQQSSAAPEHNAQKPAFSALQL